MMKKVLLGLAVVFAVLIAAIMTRPATYHVERSITAAAPPAVAQEYLSDFRNWGKWSPWEALDPGMHKKIEGASKGVGSIYYWQGNDEVGEGRMTITDMKPGEEITIKLEFIKPFASTNTTRFLTKTEGDGTRITWAMDGNNDFMGKAMSLFMDFDTMIGKDFEKGLATLKEQVEAEAKKQKEAAEAQAAAAAAAEAAPADAAPPAEAP